MYKRILKLPYIEAFWLSSLPTYQDFGREPGERNLETELIRITTLHKSITTYKGAIGKNDRVSRRINVIGLISGETSIAALSQPTVM